MEKNNDNFRTMDINLAAYLHSSGVELLDIQPQSERKSRFLFEQPPQELLDLWLSGEAPAKGIIDSYRHLIKDAVIGQRKYASTVKGGVR